MGMHCVCESRDINASYSRANAARARVSPETQTTVEHAHREKLRLGELKLPKSKADLIRKYSELSEDAELDERARFPKIPRPTQISLGAPVSI